jgi:undecaprenyl-diphosphatase
MLEKIIQFDKDLFLFINGKNTPFFDVIMSWASDKIFWIPFYLFIAYILIKEYKIKSVFIFFTISILITLCDQTASKLIKPLVKRLRPSHELGFQDIIHLSEAGPGGKYGFVSSHAANVFGLAVFLILLLPKRYRLFKIVLLIWATLVSYSRIYNGVHYPLDILGGILIGAGFGILVNYLYSKYSKFLTILFSNFYRNHFIKLKL